MRTFTFILALIVIIGIGFFIKKKEFFSNDNKVESISTKFTPDELISLVNKSSVDFIAGECASKDFIMFQSDISLANIEPYKAYRFYFIDEIPNQYYRAYEDKCVEGMLEKLSVMDMKDGILYTVKDKKNYSGFINYLAANKQEVPISIDLSNLNRDSIYVIQNCIFTDLGYNIGLEGFTIKVSSVKELVKKESKVQKTDSQAAITSGIQKNLTKKETNSEESHNQNSLPEVGYIRVNEATAYSHATDAYGAICKLEKSTELKIINKKGGFYYCDFTDDQQNAKTGWIQEDDISFESP